MRSNTAKPRPSQATASPSRRQDRGLSPDAASRIDGKRPVQSFPFRVVVGQKQLTGPGGKAPAGGKASAGAKASAGGKASAGAKASAGGKATARGKASAGAKATAGGKANAGGKATVGGNGIAGGNGTAGVNVTAGGDGAGVKRAAGVKASAGVKGTAGVNATGGVNGTAGVNLGGQRGGEHEDRGKSTDDRKPDEHLSLSLGRRRTRRRHLAGGKPVKRREFITLARAQGQASRSIAGHARASQQKRRAHVRVGSHSVISPSRLNVRFVRKMG